MFYGYTMGCRKLKLSRQVKNYERKHDGRRSEERPPKRKASACSSLIHTQPDVPLPVEAFFGKQRAAGGRNDNPTVQ